MKYSVSIMIAMLVLVSALSVKAQNKEYKLDQDYGIAADGTVFLDSDDAEVNIIASDRFDVNVNVYHRIDVDGFEWGSDDDFKMNVKQRDGDLYIEEAGQEDHTFRIGKIDREYQITVRIPRGVSIDVKGDDGMYEITDVGGAISMVADDSDISINNATGEEFSFKIDDGVIRMDKGQGKLSATLDDGKMRVEKGNFSEVNVSGDDGNIYVATALSDLGKYYFGIEDGDLELDILEGGGSIDITHDDDADINTIGTFSSVSNGEERTIYEVNGGDARVDIETEDGNIVLRHN